MRVVIADDAPLIREGLARLLAENDVEVVAQVDDAESLLARVHELQPDVAIVDVRMPPTHTDEGLRAAREIRSRYPETAVLVLSQNLELEYALRLIDQKPERVGYLMKERVGRVEQLLDAVHRVAAGECVVDSAVVEELLARRRQVDPLEELTPREREILALMAEGRSNQGICRTLWLSPKTVETHIRGAFAKLGIKEAPGRQSPRARRSRLPQALKSARHGARQRADGVVGGVLALDALAVQTLVCLRAGGDRPAGCDGDEVRVDLDHERDRSLRCPTVTKRRVIRGTLHRAVDVDLALSEMAPEAVKSPVPCSFRP